MNVCAGGGDSIRSIDGLIRSIYGLILGCESTDPGWRRGVRDLPVATEGVGGMDEGLGGVAAAGASWSVGGRAGGVARQVVRHVFCLARECLQLKLLLSKLEKRQTCLLFPCVQAVLFGA